MPFEFKVKLNKMKYSLWFVVPKQAADYLDLKAGDTLAIGVKDHEMIVRKAAPLHEIAYEEPANSGDSSPLPLPDNADSNSESSKLFRAKFK